MFVQFLRTSVAKLSSESLPAMTRDVVQLIDALGTIGAEVSSTLVRV